MTPRDEELHSLSMVFNTSVSGTAVCSCGDERRIVGKDRKRQWEAAYDWHAEHIKLAVEQ